MILIPIKTPMDKTLTRIRLITEELYLVRDELNKRAATQPGELSSALFESDASNELVAFKAAVDELRQFLWHYLNEFLGKPDGALGDRLREYQMRRAAQLLLALSAAHSYQIKSNPLESGRPRRDQVGRISSHTREMIDVTSPLHSNPSHAAPSFPSTSAKKSSGQ